MTTTALAAESRTRPRAARRRIPPALLLAAAAVALRLAMFAGRGDYVAFDEAWYLLLGRNLWAGRGYTLSGLQHVALSPLFPILAGGLASLTGHAVWAGRIIAAFAAGLLVLPCWSLFHRLGGRRTALIGCAIVALLPSMMPFVAPYWIGWDLWVGAGPLLYLFLFTGLAFALRALERSTPGDGALAGLAFGLAFLARPEALLVFGLVGMAALTAAAARRSRRLLAACLAAALGFAIPSTPYFLYLHDALGHWAVSGRGVALSTPSLEPARGKAARSGGSAVPIENMLWEGDDTTYAHALYALDASGTRMANGYWGVPRRGTARAGEPAVPPSPAASVSGADAATPAGPAQPPPARGSSALRRAWFYIRALGVVLPWFLWPFVLAGAATPGAGRRRELLVFAPLAVASLAIATLVAVDPRTQLFLAPMLAWYAARGLRLGAILLEHRARGADVRRGFPRRLVVAVVLLILLGVNARRLFLSATVGSVAQVVGEANRQVGGALEAMVPADQPVMSWSPALAVWADRDWRVLPTAPLARIMRYAGAIDARWIVFSTVNPSPLPRARMPRAFLLLHLAPGTASAAAWKLDVTGVRGQYAVGTLAPAPLPAAPPPATRREKP